MVPDQENADEVGKSEKIGKRDSCLSEPGLKGKLYSTEVQSPVCDDVLTRHSNSAICPDSDAWEERANLNPADRKLTNDEPDDKLVGKNEESTDDIGYLLPNSGLKANRRSSAIQYEIYHSEMGELTTMKLPGEHPDDIPLSVVDNSGYLVSRDRESAKSPSQVSASDRTQDTDECQFEHSYFDFKDRVSEEIPLSPKSHGRDSAKRESCEKYVIDATDPGFKGDTESVHSSSSIHHLYFGRDDIEDEKVYSREKGSVGGSNTYDVCIPKASLSETESCDNKDCKVDKDEFGYIVLDENRGNVALTSEGSKDGSDQKEKPADDGVCIPLNEDEYDIISENGTSRIEDENPKSRNRSRYEVDNNDGDPEEIHVDHRFCFTSNEVDYDEISEHGISPIEDKRLSPRSGIPDFRSVIDESGYLVPGISMGRDEDLQSTTALQSDVGLHLEKVYVTGETETNRYWRTGRG